MEIFSIPDFSHGHRLPLIFPSSAIYLPSLARSFRCFSQHAARSSLELHLHSRAPSFLSPMATAQFPAPPSSSRAHPASSPRAPASMAGALSLSLQRRGLQLLPAELPCWPRPALCAPGLQLTCVLQVAKLFPADLLAPVALPARLCPRLASYALAAARLSLSRGSLTRALISRAPCAPSRSSLSLSSPPSLLAASGRSFLCSAMAAASRSLLALLCPVTSISFLEHGINVWFLARPCRRVAALGPNVDPSGIVSSGGSLLKLRRVPP
jgi:hypothetical protein